MRTTTNPVTINYDDVICHNVLIPMEYTKFADPFLKTAFSIEDPLFGLNSILISYKMKESKKKEKSEQLKFVLEADHYSSLITGIKKKLVNEIFISELKYIGPLVKQKPEIFEQKIEDVVYSELYKTRNKIINQCLEYQKNTEKCTKMNSKVNTQKHKKECCVCKANELTGFIYRSVLEPEKYYCEKCTFKTEKIPPLLKIP